MLLSAARCARRSSHHHRWRTWRRFGIAADKDQYGTERDAWHRHNHLGIGKKQEDEVVLKLVDRITENLEAVERQPGASNKELVENITVENFESLKREACAMTVVDARSPAEFAKGHMVGAVNIPLLDDEARVLVGTCYKSSGRAAAIELGFNLVSPKAATLVENIKALTSSSAIEGKIGVYCARGGLRSNLLASLFQFALGSQVLALAGGYKAYRKFSSEIWEQWPNLVVIGGSTGSSKTRVLQELRARGEQVIDLEGLAQHLGSSFGRIGQVAPQPSCEHFANLVSHEWLSFSPLRPVYIEDEGSHLGTVNLPPTLYQKLRACPTVLRLCVPREMRIETLCETYAHHGDDKEISLAIGRLEKRLGSERTRLAQQQLQDGEFEKVADTLLAYYDKTYEKHLFKNRSKEAIREVELSSESKSSSLVQELAEKIIQVTQNPSSG
mmetsp:Transcript_1216/g.2428  ORF Transcript_1216/g.2428 Transcript_1216/m.2428 type:complete len:443 (-) Transcript_1216:421-1749(-)